MMSIKRATIEKGIYKIRGRINRTRHKNLESYLSLDVIPCSIATLLLATLFIIFLSAPVIMARTDFQGPRVRPNIIVIVADDMGFSDLGMMGSEIHTPNINSLASNGLTLTQFYNAGRCCPSRASLLTGLYAHQAGVGDMTQDRGYPAYQGFLNKNCVTLAEVLGQAGYTTGMAGKWHVGEEMPNWPQRRGFTNFYGIPQGGGAYFFPFLVKRELWLNERPVTPSVDFYSTDAFNEYATSFIEDQKKSNKPFFLYLAHIAPHFPLQAKPEDIAKYRGKYKAGFHSIREKRWQQQKKLALFDPRVKPAMADALVDNWDSLSIEQRDTLDLKMATYAAQIESMDKGIGKIITKLKETNQLHNTLIMFFSDNGGESDNAYPVKGATGPIGSAKSWASYGPSWAYVSNTPFRKYKKYVHEGGIRTPMIIHYPRLIKKGRIEKEQAGHVIDIMPTLLEVAGATYPKSYNENVIAPLKGVSLLPVIQNGTLAHRNLFWEHEGNRAVRSGQWKLVSTYPDNVWHLYDLKNDPTELNDLVMSQSGRAETLSGLYNNWALQNNVLPWDKIVNNKK
ncbi:MAG: arylsulfatase [Chitinophagaceae bacterium]|nr:MAG: arylsulfatase [Chitinophagaceae bacterium]